MNGRDLTLGILAGLAVAGLASRRGSADRERGMLVPISKPGWVRSIFDDSAWFAFSHLPDDVCVERRFSTDMGLFASWKVITKGRSGQDLSGLLTGNEIALRETLPYCAKGLEALRAQTGAPIRGLFHVGSLELNRPHRGRGIARALYRNMVTFTAEHGLAVAPGACYRDPDHPHLARGSTTQAAQRIWEDLSKEFPHTRARTRLLLWGGQ